MKYSIVTVTQFSSILILTPESCG